MGKYTRNCDHCGSAFNAPRGSKHCSHECRNYARGLPCVVCGKPTSSVKMPKSGRPKHRACIEPERICRICGDQMLSSGTGARAGERAHLKCWREIGQERICKFFKCNSPFTANSNTQLYCSKRCAIYSHQYAKGPSCAICGDKIMHQPGLDEERPMHVECKRSLWVEGACHTCGIPMDTSRAKKCAICMADGRTCSKPGCANILRAKGLCIYHYGDKFNPPLNHLRFSITAKIKREVLNRDGDTCQICDLPVDLDAHHQDRWAPSIDHIIPVSHMLFADNSSKNLRLTHYGCNSARGNRIDRDHLIAERSRKLYSQRR